MKDVIVAKYTEVLNQDYDARTKVVKSLAEEFDVTVPVVRGILVARDIYVKKEIAAKSATSGVKKEDLILAIEASYGLKMRSMRNMSVKDLKAFWEKVVEMSNIGEIK